MTQAATRRSKPGRHYAPLELLLFEPAPGPLALAKLHSHLWCFVAGRSRPADAKKLRRYYHRSLWCL